jgi:hypothetical protein
MRVKSVVAGHYDGAGHGIDLLAGAAKGVPVLIEVKKCNSPVVASLEDRPVTRLEPAVEDWRQQRERQVLAEQRQSLTELRPDARAEWKPEIAG